MRVPPIISGILLGLGWLFFAYQLMISLMRQEVRTNNGTFRPNKEPGFYWTWIALLFVIVFITPSVCFLISIGVLR